MDIATELTLAARLLVAAVLGAIIGIEREMRDQDAGVGTFAIVCLGASAFAIMSYYMADEPGSDNTRIAASVAGGIGFLGAGIILHRKNHIRGLDHRRSLMDRLRGRIGRWLWPLRDSRRRCGALRGHSGHSPFAACSALPRRQRHL